MSLTPLPVRPGVLALALLGLLQAPLAAREYPRELVVEAKTTTYVRDQAGNLKGYAAPGTRFVVRAQEEDGRCRIDFAGVSLWVSPLTLRAVDASTVSSSTDVPVTSDRGGLLGAVRPGQKYVVLGESPTTSRWRIQFGASEGGVAQRLTTRDRRPNALRPVELAFRSRQELSRMLDPALTVVGLGLLAADAAGDAARRAAEAAAEATRRAAEAKARWIQQQADAARRAAEQAAEGVQQVASGVTSLLERARQRSRSLFGL